MSDELFPNGHWKSPAVVIITIPTVLMSIAAASVALRLYARISLKKRLAVDDICIVIGLGLSIGRTVVASLTSQAGWASRSGPNASYQIPYYTHYFERRLLYALGAFFIRAGVLTYYLRLFPRTALNLKRLRGSSWALLLLSFLQCVQLCVLLGVYCNDITDLYRGRIEDYHNPHCSDAYGFTYSGAIGDAAIDAMIYLTPVPYVWGLKRLRLDQRIGLAFVFGIGSIACIFALLQIPFIIMNYRHRNGQSWFGSQVSLFIEIELALGLIAASLPDLRGLISRNMPGILQAFKHRDDSDETGSVRRASIFDTQKHVDPPRAPSSIPIGASLKMGGEGVGWRQKFKKPDWLRSEIGSLFNTQTSTPATHSRHFEEDRVKLGDVEASGQANESDPDVSLQHQEEKAVDWEEDNIQPAPG